jgi:VWFA-related protein
VWMTSDVGRSIVIFVVRVSTACAFVLVAILASAQNPPQPPPIHVTTHLVQIGVIVRDNNGPVANLTKDNFAIFDRGKPRTISIFTAEPAITSPQLAYTPSLPPNTFSDLPMASGPTVRSVTIVLLDNVNTLSGNGHDTLESGPAWMEDLALANAKAHLIEFVKNLDPRDRVAIYGLSEALHVLCDFTSDRDRLLAILKSYDTTSKTSRETVEPGAFHSPMGAEADAFTNTAELEVASNANSRRAEQTMAALQSIASHLANVPGRKNLVWLTANLPFSGTTLARILVPAQITAYPVDGRGLLSRAPIDSLIGVMDEDALARGNYMPAQAPTPIGIGAMQTLADETGGRAFVNTNDLTGAIRNAVEDSAVTYTLGFYIDSDSLDGKLHELKVQVHRAGVTLRYPRGYFALKDAPATKNELHDNFVVAIKSPLDSSAIPLEVKVDRVNQPKPNSLSLSGSIGIRDLRFAQAGNLHVGTLEVIVLEQDQTGKVLRQSNSRISLRFTEEKYSALLKSGINFRKSVQPQTDAVTLRVIVQDAATAAIGSLIIPLSQLK